MNIIIFGGSGKVGTKVNSFIIKNYKNKNFKIINISRFEQLKVESSQVVYSKCNLSNEKEIEEIFLMYRPSAVINLSVSYGDYKDQFNINVRFVSILSNFSTKYNSKLFHFSSSAIFLDSAGSIYKQTKILGEIEALKSSNIMLLRISAQRSKISFYSFSLRLIKILPKFIFQFIPQEYKKLRLTGPMDINETAKLVSKLAMGEYFKNKEVINLFGANWFFLFDDKIERRLSERDTADLIKKEYNFHVTLCDDLFRVININRNFF